MCDNLVKKYTDVRTTSSSWAPYQPHNLEIDSDKDKMLAL